MDNVVDHVNWGVDYVTSRRLKQEEAGIYQYSDKFKTEFAIDVPCSYACSRCLTDDHVLAKCTMNEKKCLKCGKFGHISSRCKYQLCATCKMYGHGRQVCPKSNACFTCGRPGHEPYNCSKRKYFCRLCGGNHAMTSCPEYDGECYQHCGRHLYINCPGFK
uniref:CCHC-type domain-containing protein n=1 Tax=Panagrolaimus sp. JU765 TaxID=591449 RepID=A0AC34Q172_9BILA